MDYRGLRRLACTGVLFTSTLGAGLAAGAGAESRQPYSETAPAWLRAVGVLNVPVARYRDGRRYHYVENCSATLVAERPGGHADTIITAWHCFEDYDDLSRPITFTLRAGLEEHFVSTAYRLADGGGMHADWALLRLQRPVPAGEVTAMLVQSGTPDPDGVITMAGFSRDPGLGMGGTRLTFDSGCRITRQASAVSEAACTAYKGASGGAVVQVSAGGEARLSGVISSGDGAGVVVYVPVQEFRTALSVHLN